MFFRRKTKINRLNIGAGAWHCDGWTNLDYPSEWYKGRLSQNPYIAYDIRKDNLPFADASVERIYCSHVLEHIEEEHIQNLFYEAWRVLQPSSGGGGGMMRLAFPDAIFLHAVTQAAPAYWQWRNEWFQGKWRAPGTPNPAPLDYLIREVATPRCRQYLNMQDPLEPESLMEQFAVLPAPEFLDLLVKGLVFRPDCPGDHINWWSFEKCAQMLRQAGFSTIIHSRWGGSVDPVMQNISIFDLTAPWMSCYVEAFR